MTEDYVSILNQPVIIKSNTTCTHMFIVLYFLHEKRKISAPNTSGQHLQTKFSQIHIQYKNQLHLISVLLWKIFWIETKRDAHCPLYISLINDKQTKSCPGTAMKVQIQSL